jgi:hypothetical protein
VPWAGRYISVPPRFEMFSYFELLFNSVTLGAGTDTVELRRLGSKVLQLTPVGPNLYRATDRIVASHALLSSGLGVSKPAAGALEVAAPRCSGVCFAVVRITVLLGLAAVCTVGLGRLIARVFREIELAARVARARAYQKAG